VFSHFQESRAPPHIAVTWEDKKNITPKVPPFFFPQGLLLCMMSYGTGHPFGQLGSAVLPVSPPSHLCTPSLLAGGVVQGVEKALTVCKHCSAATKDPCVINIVFSTNSKHSLILATMNKINSTQPKQPHSPSLIPYHLCHSQVPYYPIHPH